MLSIYSCSGDYKMTDQPLFACAYTKDSSFIKCERRSGLKSEDTLPNGDSISIEGDGGVFKLPHEDLFTLDDVKFGNEIMEEEADGNIFIQALTFSGNCMTALKEVCFRHKIDSDEKSSCSSEGGLELYRKSLRIGNDRNKELEINLLVSNVIHTVEALGKLYDTKNHKDAGKRLVSKPKTSEDLSIHELYRFHTDAVVFDVELPPVIDFIANGMGGFLEIEISGKTKKKAGKILRKTLSQNKFLDRGFDDKFQHPLYFSHGGIFGTAKPTVVSGKTGKGKVKTTIFSEPVFAEESIKRNHNYVRDIGVEKGSMKYENIRRCLQIGSEAVLTAFHEVCKPLARLIVAKNGDKAK